MLSYVLLGRRDKNGELRPVGAFLPELYILAKARKLAWHLDLRPTKLYTKDKKWKSDLELAIIPHITYGEIEKEFKDAITRTTTKRGAQIGDVVDLPAPLVNYRIMTEYLPHLAKLGLEVYSEPHREKNSLFNVIRDLISTFRKQSTVSINFSIQKALISTGLWASMGIAIYYGVKGAFASTLGLSTWSAMAALGVPATLITGASLLAAASVAATAALGLGLGLSSLVRYFWTFSLFNNVIESNWKIQEAAERLPFVVSGEECIDKSVVNSRNEAFMTGSFPMVHNPAYALHRAAQSNSNLAVAEQTAPNHSLQVSKTITL